MPFSVKESKACCAAQAPEDQWKKLEDATRESFDSFRQSRILVLWHRALPIHYPLVEPESVHRRLAQMSDI